MTFAFHNLKNIVEAYHPKHLRLVFEICLHYRIWLNPGKCIFCVRLVRLLGFLVSEIGIMVYSLKVEAILRFPLPHTIRKLQSLQGKDKFLRRFIEKYANITKVFMCLLKKDSTFIRDEWTQESFDALKKALVSTPLLKFLDYSRDF